MWRLQVECSCCRFYGQGVVLVVIFLIDINFCRLIIHNKTAGFNKIKPLGPFIVPSFFEAEWDKKGPHYKIPV